MNKLPYFHSLIVSNFIKDTTTFVNLMCVNKKYNKLNMWYNGSVTKINPGFINSKLFSEDYELPQIKYKTIAINNSDEILYSEEIRIFEDYSKYKFRNFYSVYEIRDIITRYNFIRNTQFNIELESKLLELPEDSFTNCYKLNSIIIPTTITKINDKAFSSCYQLSNITIPSSVVSMGNKVFSCCLSLNNIVIPSSVTSIGEGLFNRCYKLKNVRLPNTLTKITTEMFMNCTSLEEIYLPSSIVTIKDRAFKNCFKLKLVYFTSKLQKVSLNAFEGCQL